MVIPAMSTMRESKATMPTLISFFLSIIIVIGILNAIQECCEANLP
jgi:hypothetical protein